MRYLTIVISVGFLLNGCGRKIPEGIYKEGRIEYKISYLENNLSGVSPALLPKKMKLEFNNAYSTNVIEGFMGVFKLNNVINFRHRRSSTLLEVLNKHYYYKGKRGDEICCFEPMDNMHIEYTGEVREIAGLKCNKAIISIPEKNERFEVFYTNEIYISDPNITNPYKEINGVLMDFRLNLSGLKMKFVAEKFENTNRVKPEPVDLPDHYTEVTREQMTQIINKLVE